MCDRKGWLGMVLKIYASTSRLGQIFGCKILNFEVLVFFSQKNEYVLGVLRFLWIFWGSTPTCIRFGVISVVNCYRVFFKVTIQDRNILGVYQNFKYSGVRLICPIILFGKQ